MINPAHGGTERVHPEDPDHPTVRFKGDGSYCEAQMLIVDGEVLDGYEPASAIAA